MICNADARMIPLDEQSVQCVVTSPPYFGLRDYGVGEQIGLEETIEDYIASIVEVFDGLWRVLKDDGVVWLNLGDSYFSTTKGGGGSSSKQMSNAGSYYELVKISARGMKPKDLMMVPHRVAIALQERWYVRQEIVWHKPNPMPESVTDRCTRAHEYVFMLTKSARYYYDADSIKEESVDLAGTMSRYEYRFSGRPGLIMPDGKPQAIAPKGERAFGGGRNKRSVWTVTTKPYSGAHFATFPPDLVEPMVLAGCMEGGVVLDPFCGSGTVGMVCRKHKRMFVGLDLSIKYLAKFALPRSEEQQTKASIEELPLFGGITHLETGDTNG